MRRRSFLIGAAASLPLAGCLAPPKLGAGTGVTVTPLKTYSTLQSSALLKLAGVKGVAAAHAVDCYRVSYPSHDAKGRPIRLSGMFAMPRGVAAKGLVSWQHGTTTTRAEVPSNLSTDGAAAAIVFGGNGYATVAADYIGLGESMLTHTYLVADDTARAVIDLIHAARTIPGTPATAPFLIGFSQGGHASLAAQQTMEAAGEAVLGVASVAGPHNLRTISFPAALKGGSPSHSLYLSYMARGYSARYDQPLESVLTGQAAALCHTLYDQPHKPDDIIAALPKAPRSLFTPAFLDDFDQGRPNWLLQAIGANETSHFTSKAPVRLYYGHSDIDVPPAEATTTAAMLTQRGARAVSVDVGPYDHNPSILHAAPLALDWLLRGVPA